MTRLVCACVAALILCASSVSASTVWRFTAEAHVFSISALPDVIDPDWRMIGAMDVDANTIDDLIWYNKSTQAVVVWYLIRVYGFPYYQDIIELDHAVVVTGAALPTPAPGRRWLPVVLPAILGIEWRDVPD